MAGTGFEMVRASRSQPPQRLLRDAGHQGSVLVDDRSACQSAGVAVADGLGLVEVPSLRVERAVQPQRVVEAAGDPSPRGGMMELRYMSATEEMRHTVAQANAELDEDGKFVQELVSTRQAGDFMLNPPANVDLIDVSPKQLVSVAAALIPLFAWWLDISLWEALLFDAALLIFFLFRGRKR